MALDFDNQLNLRKVLKETSHLSAGLLEPSEGLVKSRYNVKPFGRLFKNPSPYPQNPSEPYEGWHPLASF